MAPWVRNCVQWLWAAVEAQVQSLAPGQWVKGSSIAIAVAWIPSLAQKLPYAVGLAKKERKKERKEGRKRERKEGRKEGRRKEKNCQHTEPIFEKEGREERRKRGCGRVRRETEMDFVRQLTIYRCGDRGRSNWKNKKFW